MAEATSAKTGGVRPRRIGNYVTRDVLGEGAMGIVYRAENRALRREVAIKVLHADLCRRRDLVERFVTEARAASAIRSPRIASVLDYGELAGGQAYLVMELLVGRTLGRLLAEETLSLERAVHIARGVAEALAAAHSAGVVHRDLTPENVFLVEREGDPDYAKLLDFGVAKLRNEDGAARTETGVVLGTPAYMAPEQARGAREVDHRADIYSLGVVLYRMLAGRLPFEAEGLGGLLLLQMTETPAPPSRHREGVPAALEAVCLRALAKAPEDRYASMVDFDAALAGALRERPADRGGVAATARGPTPRRRAWPRAALLATGISALGVFGLSLRSCVRHDGDAASRAPAPQAGTARTTPADPSIATPYAATWVAPVVASPQEPIPPGPGVKVAERPAAAKPKSGRAPIPRVAVDRAGGQPSLTGEPRPTPVTSPAPAPPKTELKGWGEEQ